jgi:predicted translin family RNA/ssDNA-binding protein
VEDYLHGLVSVVNELSRLAVNSVTLQNYEEPFRISGFIKDVFAGFSMVCLGHVYLLMVSSTDVTLA